MAQGEFSTIKWNCQEVIVFNLSIFVALQGLPIVIVKRVAVMPVDDSFN